MLGDIIDNVLASVAKLVNVISFGQLWRCSANVQREGQGSIQPKYRLPVFPFIVLKYKNTFHQSHFDEYNLYFKSQHCLYGPNRMQKLDISICHQFKPFNNYCSVLHELLLVLE